MIDKRPHAVIVLEVIAARPMPLRQIVEATGLHQDDVRRALARLKYAGRAQCGRRDGVPSTYWSEVAR